MEEEGLVCPLLRLATADPPGRVAALTGLETGDQLQHGVTDPVQVGTELDQHLRGHALTLADQAEQDVLGPDVGVVELQRFAQAQLQDLLGPGGVNGMCPVGDC